MLSVSMEMSDLEPFSSDRGDIRESLSGQTAHQRARDCIVFGDLLPPTLDDNEEGTGGKWREWTIAMTTEPPIVDPKKPRRSYLTTTLA